MIAARTTSKPHAVDAPVDAAPTSDGSTFYFLARSSGSPAVFEVCNYKCTKLLGRGGFGKVYLGEAPGGVPCAVKIVEARREDNEAATRELSALEVIKTLRHPYLLFTSAFFSLEDKLVIVMELADGSLRDELEKSRKANKKGLPPVEPCTCARRTRTR